MRATISVLGLYNADDTIFDPLTVPEGMDRDTVIRNIIVECAELETLFPDPDVFKEVIGFWSKSESWLWSKMWTASNMEYNPIWNKDGTITETEARDITNTRNLANTRNNTQTRNLATGGSNTNTRKESAYNETTFQNREEITDVSTGSDTGTVTDQGGGSDTGTVRDAGTITRRRTEQGNIGVTTTQAMLQEEMKLRQDAMNNVYYYIVESFKSRFCLLVY